MVMSLNGKKQLLLIFVLAVLVRIGAMVVLESYVYPSEKHFGFTNARIANNIVLGKGFSWRAFKESTVKPAALTPPGYVYVIALAFAIFGSYSNGAAIALEIFQILAAALSAVAIYYIGRRIDERVGILAAVGLALYPPSIFFSVKRIGPVIHVVLLLILIMGYLFKLQEEFRSRDAVICGILMGINALLEPAVILFYVFGCIWLVSWSRESWYHRIRVSAIMAFVCIAVISPWMVRNALVFGRFVPIKAALGRNMLEGNNPYGTGVVHDFQFEKYFSAEEYSRLVRMDHVSADNMMLKKAVSFIKSDPKLFVERTLKRMYYFWSVMNPYRRTPEDYLRVVTYGPVLLLAAMGLIMAGRRWREMSLIVALFVSYPLPYYFAHVSIYRYRFIIEPFLVLVAAYGVVRLYERFWVRSSAQVSYSVAGREESPR